MIENNKFNNNFTKQNKNNNFQQHKVNMNIKASNVRVITADGQQLGILTLNEALHMAIDQGLDLIEINSTTNPPICKLIEYSKFKYEEEKRKKEQRKNQSKVTLKEIGIRPNTGEHDLETKANAISRMLKENNKVKINVTVRGRESLHPEQIKKAVSNLLQLVGSHTIDTPLKIEARVAYMVIAK